MKKITLLVLVFLSFTSWSQNPNYRYHELQDLGPNIEWAIAVECTQHYSPVGIREVNLRQNFKLEVGKIYKADLGLNYGNFGTRYYKVTYAGDAGTDKGDEIDTPPDFGSPITDLCNTLSRKYIRPILLGSTLQEAQNNFCSNLTVNTTREMVNIRIAKSLSSGDICFMDFGKGANYYLIDGADVESGDADYEVDSTDSNSLFSLVAFNCQKPDLQAVSVEPNIINDNYYRGSTKSAKFNIRNIGTNIQNATTTATLYLSKTRNFLNGNDIQLTTEVKTPANVNANLIANFIYTIPNNVSNDKYYLNLKVTNSEDFNTYNNIVSSSSKITIKDGTPPTTPPTTSPTTPTGTPDFIIDSDKTIITSECDECSKVPLSEIKDKRHRINNQAGSINLSYVAVKNTGNGVSPPTNVTFYLSSNTTLDTADLKSNGSTVKINAVKGGESYVIPGGTIFPSDFSNTGTTFQNNWNILMVVDDSKTITESNENNNVTVIPVTFYNPFAKTATATLVTNEQVEPYSINVYNLEGKKVLTKEVTSKEEENKSLDSLKSGIYIIKSKNETRKVIK